MVMNKKIYFNPTMKVVMMKTVRMLADSGGVSTGDKPGDEYTPTDPTYSRQDGWTSDED